ncbi:MAG: long-chain fatty acid--CoA ligase [Thermodesulfobacteriota bacterium]
MPPTPPDRPWLASYDPQVPPDPAIEAVPVFEYLDRAARDFPEREALRFQNLRMTYAALLERAERAAAALRRLGVGPGDRVALMLPNLPQTMVAYWAVLKAGAVAVMVNPLYMESELTHQLGDAGCSTMIVLDHLWPKVASLRERLPVRRYIVTGVAHGLRFPLGLLFRLKMWRAGQRPDVPYDRGTVLRWETLFAGKERLSHPPADPGEDLALLQYTGGTTGIAKGVMVTHANLSANVQQCATQMHAFGRGRETFLAVLPFFHVYGLTVCLNLPAALAATVYPIPRYVPGDLLRAIQKLRPTIFPGAPAIYGSLMQQKDLARYDISSLRYLVSGSAPLPLEVQRRFRELTGAEIIEGYGLTEASPVTHFNPLGGVRKSGSIGLPLPATDARIVDLETGRQVLGPGQEGELCIRGPQVMRGYWRRPEDTAATLRDGWLYTGDVAAMDGEGYFSIVDRKKDLVIVAGYNVYPREIEEVLYAHPKVKEAAAVGVPNPARGETIKAYVVPREGETLQRSEIVAWCRKKLAGYKVPRDVEIRADLPKTLVGKVLRRALRDEEAARPAAPEAPGAEGATP